MKDDDEDRQRRTWRRLRDQQEGDALLGKELTARGWAYLYPDEVSEEAALRTLRERMEQAGYLFMLKL